MVLRGVMLFMLKVNLFDKNFAHSKSVDGFDASSRVKPTKIEYIRDQLNFDGVTIFTDDMIFDPIVSQVKSKFKIAWCQESSAIKPLSHSMNLIRNDTKFDYIITHNLRMIERDPQKYKYMSIACCWVPNNIGLQPKTKSISHIITDKRFTEGHLLRHQIAEKLKDVDVYGYKPFNKIEPHKDYMYSIIIENCQSKGYFSEKIIDCIVQGTVPIYWGDFNINKIFNPKGIITFNTIEDLYKIKLNINDYQSRTEAIKENIEICKQKYISSDDNLADLLNDLLKCQ
jgi:hypothetical protein